jgi:hypothetical protein
MEEMNKPKISIFDLGLGPRVLNVFKVNNICLDDILANKYNLNDFVKLPNIGRKSVKEIKEAFLDAGYRFPDSDKYFRNLNTPLKSLAEHEQMKSNLYVDLNLDVIDKCRKTLITSFNNIVERESFSHQEFNNVMDEHKKILNMFEQNVRNVL